MRRQSTGTAPLTNKDRMTRALIGHVQPTHFITLSLCQARMIVNEHGVGHMLRGDDTIYQQAHASFMRSLSKRFASRSQWRQQPKPIIPNACTIEGGSNGERYHLHLIVAKPEHVTEECFRRTVCGIAHGHPWIMNGEYAVNIQSLADDHEVRQKAYYSVKRGVDRICL